MCMCVFILLIALWIKTEKFDQNRSFTYLVRTDRVSSVEYEQMIVAVQLQPIKVYHEPLQDGVRLERGHAV